MKKSITIKDILATPSFKDFKILAGESGINNEVSSITIMDSPDPFPWSKGGEIVLSSGYIFKKHESEFAELIIKMKNSGIVALFIKVKRYFDEIPRYILELSDKIGFVVVSVPIERAFVDVINPTLSRIVNHQSEIIKISEKIHSDFTNLVINGDDTSKIIKLISKLLNEDICYYDLRIKEMYFYGESKCYDIYPKLSNVNELLDSKEQYIIGMNNRIYGYIIFLNRDKGNKVNDDFNSLRHANTALILDTQKKISSMQIENRHKNEFVQDIITNNIKSKIEVEKRANTFGWSFKKYIRTLVVDIDNFKDEYLKIDSNDINGTISNEDIDDIRDNILNSAIRIVKSYFIDSVYVNLSDSTVFLIHSDNENYDTDNRIKKLCDNIQNLIKNKFNFTVSIGIGNSKNDITQIYKSYKESQISIKIGRIMHKSNSALFYSELGIYRLLYSIYQNEEVQDFCKSSIGKLIEYDKQHNSELFNSIIAIVECDWNIKAASELMYTHYNTMKYRYKKIASLIGEDLNKSEVRLNLSLALKVYRMNN